MGCNNSKKEDKKVAKGISEISDQSVSEDDVSQVIPTPVHACSELQTKPGEMFSLQDEIDKAHDKLENPGSSDVAIDINVDRDLDAVGTKKIPVLAKQPSVQSKKSGSSVSSKKANAAAKAPLKLNTIRQEIAEERTATRIVQRTEGVAAVPVGTVGSSVGYADGAGSAARFGSGRSPLMSGEEEDSRDEDGVDPRERDAAMAAAQAGPVYDDNVYVLHTKMSTSDSEDSADRADADELAARRKAEEDANALPSISPSNRFTLYTVPGGEDNVSNSVQAELGIPKHPAIKDRVYDLKPDQLARAERKTAAAGGNVPLPPAVQYYKNQMFNEPQSTRSSLSRQRSSKIFFEKCPAHRVDDEVSTVSEFAIFDTG